MRAKMKFLIPFLLIGVAFAQQNPISLQSSSPSAVTTVSASGSGGAGGSYSSCYIVVARYLAGNAAGSQPACADNIALNVTVSWQGVQGATGYDVIRISRSGPQPPTPC